MVDALELSLDIARRHHITISKMAEVEFHARLKAPVEIDFVNRDRALRSAGTLVHRRVKVIWRVQMRAVVRAQLNRFHRPHGFVRQIRLLQAGKERLHLVKRVLMVEILDLRRKCRRIGDNIVFEIDREINKFAWHGGQVEKLIQRV